MSTKIVALTLAAFTAAGSAAAQTAPPGEWTVTGGATLVNDDRFRGRSPSDGDPAVRATAAIQGRSGPYAGVSASWSDREIADGGVAALDLIAGYRRTRDGTTRFVMRTNFLGRTSR